MVGAVLEPIKMPLNNPVEKPNGGNTVFIDAALSELPSQIMQQDLDTLVGLNIHPSDLDSLQVSNEDRLEVSSGGVIITDNADHMTGLDTAESLPTCSQPMEVESLADNDNVLSDINLLGDAHEFIPIMGNEDILEENTANHSVVKKHTFSIGGGLQNMNQESDVSMTHSSGTENSLAPATHILKTSTGQFIVLQPNQNSVPISSLNNKMFSSANLILSSMASNVGSKMVKTTFVNSNQLIGNTIRQTGVVRTAQPQFRTVQLKQPISLSGNSQNNTVTKVILTSQSGGNLGQQLRLITSQAAINNPPNANTNISNNNNNSNLTATTNSSKLTFQFQPMGLSMSSGKAIIQSPVKTQLNDVKTTKIKIPIAAALKNVNSTLQQFTSLQPNEVHNSQVISQADTKLITASTTNTKNIIVPLSSALKPGQIVTSSGAQLIKIPVSQLQQLTNQIHNVSLPSKVNLRIVPSSISTSSSAQSGSTAHTTQSIIKNFTTVSTKPVLAPAIPNSMKPTKTAPLHLTHIHPKQQRFIIPASVQKTSASASTSSLTNSISGIQIRGQNSITLPASALPSGVLSNAQPGSLVMIPAQFFQNANNAQNASQNFPMSLQSNIKPAPVKTVIDANVIKPRKPCNCTKSQCLKLYCDCFANGEFCNNCNCINCSNNLSHEEDRQKAIKCCLERNPLAFRPKIGKGGTDTERRHNKGCNCKRSGCLKNYCECYEAKIPCSNMCKCVGCRNMDGDQPYQRKRLLQLAEAAEARVGQHLNFKNRPISLSLPSPTKMALSLSAKNNYCRISQEVVEATCHCLLAQAEKAEKSRSNSPQKMELMVLNEFSRCLIQIIGFNSKAKVSSAS